MGHIQSMRTLSLLITALLTLENASAFICPVETQNITLSNGAVVGTPLCYSDTLGLTIEGSANLAVVNDMLAPHGVYAVPMDGKAMVQLSAVNHRKTNIGAYREIVVGVLATNDPNNRGGIKEFLKMLDVPGPPLSKNVFIYSMAIWVDTEVAKLAGPEIWGLEKSYGTIDAKEGYNSTQEIFLMDKFGPILFAQWKRPVMPFPQYLDTYIVSPMTIKQTKARAWFSALGKKQPWNNSTDKLTISKAHPFGNKLLQMEFTPTNKIYVPHNKSIFYAP